MHTDELLIPPHPHTRPLHQKYRLKTYFLEPRLAGKGHGEVINIHVISEM